MYCTFPTVALVPLQTFLTFQNRGIPTKNLTLRLFDH